MDTAGNVTGRVASGRQPGAGRGGRGWVAVARRHATPALVLAAMGCLLAGGASWLKALRYDRDAITAGEWWRLVTAHWVHLGPTHALLDGLGLLLLWQLYGAQLRSRGLVLAFVAATATVDAGLWWLAPGVAWYAGISGLLHGLWSAGALLALWQRVPLAWAPSLLLAGKLAHEAFGGAAPAAGLMPVVAVAHLYGALGGLAAGCALLPWAPRARQPL
jgi:rhomboid family GlyGly-CTERM serine protease